MKEFIKNILAKISIPDILLLVCVVIMVITPNSKFDNKEIDMAEKRKLANFPKIITDKHFNQKFGHEFENFYNDRHRKRPDCISFKLDFFNFIDRRNETDMGVEGLDGWYFFKGDASVANFQNKILFTDDELLKIKNNMERLDKWGKDHDIKIIFLIPPDKNRIYGEFYPRQYKKVNPKSRVQLLKEYLDKNSDIDLIYPVDVIMQRRAKDNELLYYKLDTHWTGTGAYQVYTLLIDKINKETSHNFEIIDIDKFSDERKTFKEEFNVMGDICTNMHLSNCEDVTYKPLSKFKDDYKPKKYNYKIHYLGDSFSGRLLALTGHNFNTKQYFYNAKPELFENFSIKLWEDEILQDHPDVLVVENLERFADKLLELYRD